MLVMLLNFISKAELLADCSVDRPLIRISSNTKLGRTSQPKQLPNFRMSLTKNINCKKNELRRHMLPWHQRMVVAAAEHQLYIPETHHWVHPAY
jgi:hypothetical protein